MLYPNEPGGSICSFVTTPLVQQADIVVSDMIILKSKEYKKMIQVHYNKDQAQALVDRWNELANEKYQLTHDKAHLLFTENSDSEMEQNGYISIEVGSKASKTGRPVTFDIYRSDVEIVEG